MLNKMQKKKIIEALSRWASGDFVNMITGKNGICGNLRDVRACDSEELAPYFRSWDEFSGTTDFPVPHPREKDPRHAYMNFWGNMWEFKYGEARMRLCAHIASEMEKEL